MLLSLIGVAVAVCALTAVVAAGGIFDGRGLAAALALAGAEMQTVLNNPLASPFTLGVSSAASLGAALATAAGVAAAATTDFSTTTATWIRAVIAALAVVAATLAAGRALAVRTARGAAPADPA